MGPKKKVAEVKELGSEVEVERADEDSYAEHSPGYTASSASSYSSRGTVTSEQLERILESNQLSLLDCLRLVS